MRNPVRTRLGGTVRLVVLAAAVLCPALAAGELEAVFGYPAKIHSPSASMFPKWSEVQQRTIDAGPDGPPCVEEGLHECHYRKLVGIADRARKLPLRRQIEFVHEYVNRLTYITDFDLYGVSDYWATQFQFYGHDGGDCEDYSISKYYALRLLGLPPDALRLTIVRDTNLRADHAVLVVEADDRFWLLDSNQDKVVDTGRVHHMLPYYSINENHWWSYIGVPKDMDNY
ncbi:MAG: transglutaminase-like cysteine peptidase [Gammaproteobacteria bacterium]|nr:transglutaminase-like cysteine peptidase [Gammaproteobacteria bacterium]MCP5316288.1 transglutaminase-like cysteine peptidase [Chromatiaceae bacterium]